MLKHIAFVIWISSAVILAIFVHDVIWPKPESCNYLALIIPNSNTIKFLRPTSLNKPLKAQLSVEDVEDQDGNKI